MPPYIYIHFFFMYIFPQSDNNTYMYPFIHFWELKLFSFIIQLFVIHSHIGLHLIQTSKFKFSFRGLCTEWVSDYCFTPNEHYFSLIKSTISYILWDDNNVRLAGIFVLSQWINSPARRGDFSFKDLTVQGEVGRILGVVDCLIENLLRSSILKSPFSNK